MNEPQDRMLAMLAKALTRAQDLGAAMTMIEAVRHERTGNGLLTINAVKDTRRINHEVHAIELERIWSSQQHAYPVSGRKHKSMTSWTRQVFCEKRVFCAEGDAALTATFEDSALILSLGMHASIHAPLVSHDGLCLATFNILGTRPAWTHEEVSLMQGLATLATPFVAQHLAQTA